MFRHGMLRRGVAIALVTVLGTTAVPALADEGPWIRLAGENAYDTMREVVAAAEAFEPDRVDTVILATGDDYWDALSASGLAGRLDAPVLITPKNSLIEQTREELMRLAPERVVVMGGPLAITEEVEAQLKELDGLDLQVDRVWGQGAPDTAVEAWREGEGWSTTAVIATSHGYWDALSIAPYAYAKGAPIFLTSQDNRLDDTALSAIREGGFTRAVIVGGNMVVSLDVEEQLSGLNVVRLAGKDAIGTSAAIARWELGEGMSIEGMCVATVGGHWDALTGAALAGSTDSVLVLTSEGNYEAIDAAFDEARTFDLGRGHVLGGPQAVPDSTWAYLRGEGPAMPATPAVDPDPASPAAADIRRELGIQTALFDSFSHGDKPARYQRYIMLHDTEELEGPWGIVEFWLNHHDQQVAAHFVVGRDGSIVQCVPMDRIAFHAGAALPGSNERFGITDDGRDGKYSGSYYDGAMNEWSVGIEICHVGTTGTGHEIEPDYPQAQLEALDRLIAYIDAYYGFESTIIDHKDWTAGNPDTSAEFERYLANYRTTRTHDGR